VQAESYSFCAVEYGWILSGVCPTDTIHKDGSGLTIGFQVFSVETIQINGSLSVR